MRSIIRRERKSNTKPGKIAAIRIDEPEERWIALVTHAVTPQHFQRQHQANVVAAGARAPGIHHAALLPSHEERRFLVDESNEADRDAWHLCHEESRDFEQGGNAARVVIGARAAAYRVIVGPHDKDLLRLAAAAPRYRDLHRDIPRSHTTGMRLTLLAPFRLDVLAGRAECCGPKDIALAKLAGEAFDTVPDPLGSHDLRLAHYNLLKTSKLACRRYLRRSLGHMRDGSAREVANRRFSRQRPNSAFRFGRSCKIPNSAPRRVKPDRGGQ
jgi:hypothetical protein